MTCCFINRYQIVKNLFESLFFWYWIAFLWNFTIKSFLVACLKNSHSCWVSGYACLHPRWKSNVTFEVPVLILENKAEYSAFFFQSTNDQKEKQLRELTQLCLSIGILFLICESPRTILPIYHRFVPRSLTSRLLTNVAYLFSAFDHSMNFFIYVLRGDRYREALYEVVPYCAKRRRQSIKLGGVLSDMSVQTISQTVENTKSSIVE